MDKETRNAIERATQRARKLLEDDYAAQLEGDFDIHANGGMAPAAGSHLKPRQVYQRDRIVAAIEHKRAVGMSAADAVADYLRDAAFTTLNRFAALKMLEARDLVQQCITKGKESSGYREFCLTAHGVALLPDDAGYRLYIECLFDELSTEVKVLFDRRDSASVLWPRRATFEALLALLNVPELAGVWAEDETIGWIYQYFNSQDERRKMREESQAPRNSRELAVRNQFFTPRYVVQFLTDNTLGRIWYEMRETRTALADRCEYMVRKPHETFPPRAKKDPRDIRVLDPACGSGHFLLYAFDLLLTIYEEAYADPASPRNEATGRTLAEDYPTIEELRVAMPGLILAHNLHGVDIDARCAQIAQLALWMRAQRAWADAGVHRGVRPQLRRVNVVIAEAMPGNKTMVEEFVPGLAPAPLQQLFRAMLKKMDLAGEAGLLLRPDEILASAIDEARQSYRQWRGPGTVARFPGLELLREPDLSGVTDGAFFHDAERLIREALVAYVSRAELTQSVRRRLFADDALQGLALIDVSETQFDVVLMNPPFGEPTKDVKRAGGPDLSNAEDDLGAAFLHAAATKWAKAGVIGAVTSSTIWFKHTLGDWRRSVLLGETNAIALGAHLGGHVLDNASVGAAATVVAPTASTAVFFRCLRAEDKAEALKGSIDDLREGVECPPSYRVSIAALREYRKSPLAYWITPALRTRLTGFPALEGSAAEVRVGVQCSDDPRFVRAWWEIPTDRVGLEKAWVPFAKSSEYSPFWDDITWIIRWENDGAEVRAYDRSRPQNIQYFGHPGVTFPARAVLGFNPRAFPAGIGFGHMGSVAFPKDSSPSTLLGFLFSRPAEYVLSFSNGSLQGRKGAYQNHYEVGQVGDLPWPEFDIETSGRVSKLGESIARAAMLLQRNDETGHQHEPPRSLRSVSTLDDYIAAEITEDRRLIHIVQDARASLDQIVSRALGFTNDDIEAMNEEFEECDAPATGPWSRTEPRIDDELRRSAAQSIISLAVGIAIGHFDARRFASPFDDASEQSPLGFFTAAPNTVLYGRNTRTSSGSGIAMLTIDRTDPDLTDSQLGEILSMMWSSASPDAISQLTAALQVNRISHYLADPGPSGFYTDHTRRYSKGRRRAPLYLWLGTESGSFGVLLLVPALTTDTIFILRNDVVAPRLSRAERHAEIVRTEAGPNPTPQRRAAIDRADSFVSELRAFAAELDLHMPLWRPVVDDGIVVNAAPFHRLIPHRESRTRAEATWKELLNRKLDWAYLAMRFWPEHVVPKCATDRSFAIAHGLEDVFWAEGDDGKWTARKTPTRPIEELVRERTSPAVKAALKNLLAAPPVTGQSGRGRKAKAKEGAR